MNYLAGFNIVLIVGAVQAAYLMASLSFLKKGHQSNRLLVALLGLLLISLVLRLSYSPALYLTYPHLTIAADFVMFAVGPVYYLYVIRLLYENTHFNFRLIIHFVPLLIFLTSLAYLAFKTRAQVVEMDRAGKLDGYYLIILTGAIIQLGVYLYLVKKELREYTTNFKQQYSSEMKADFISSVTVVMILALAAWTIAFLVSLFLPAEFGFFTNLSYQVAFVILCVLLFVISYYVIHRPDLIRVSIQRKEKYGGQEITSDQLMQLKERLAQLFENEKPFRDPDLSLRNLSRKLGVNQTHVSRVINEGFEKNFFDYVNGYRVREFIDLASSEEYANYTLLGIAFEVGFRTKSTFNKSFKKETGRTPREYLKKKGSAQLKTE